jgi:selenocysteine lyase/cysteine desulfurase
MEKTEIAAARQVFPVLEELVYLNTGTLGIMAGPVVERYTAMLRHFEQGGVIVEPEAMQQAEVARARLATYLHATADEIALTGNATDGIAFVAAALSWSPDDEVLISDQEHAALVFPYTYLQQHGGARLRRFRVTPDPEQTLANFREALVPGKTRLAAFSHLTCQTGTRLPVRALAEAAHGAGAWCFLDASQSFGQLEPSAFDAGALGVDMVTSNGHKWLGAAKGTGFLYVRRDLLQHLAPAHVGAGALNWPRAIGDEPAPGVEPRLDTVPSARRFEYGTRNGMVYASIPLALDWLETLGWDEITAHERQLALELRRRLKDIPGVTLLTPERWEDSGAMTSFTLEGWDCLEVAKRLWEQGRVSVRTVPELNAIRISTAYYNNQQDLEQLLDGIAPVS